MSANRAKNSGPEVTLRKALWHTGLRGYRLHRRIRLASSPRLPSPVSRLSSVRPDISFVSRKLAIFVHGCFWHRCPKCDYSLPKTNTEFWQAKFDRNVARDQRKVQELEANGWTVITVWECELKENLHNLLQTIITILK